MCDVWVFLIFVDVCVMFDFVVGVVLWVSLLVIKFLGFVVFGVV